MPDYISITLLEKKALDRWENEGGMISANEAETSKSDQTSVSSSNVANKSFIERHERDFVERFTL